METQNTRAVDDLRSAYSNKIRCGDLKAFCVSNTLYDKHRKAGPASASQILELSGIPTLKKYCESLSAEAQFKALAAFLEHQVPTLVGSVRQWLLQGSDDVTLERGKALQDSLVRARDQYGNVWPGYKPNVIGELTLPVESTSRRA